MAVAGTPDGSTPAEETVCDGLSGASKGICNAYCEAKDCDLDDGSNASKSRACERLASKYQDLTGEDLPCGQQAACPCVAAIGGSVEEVFFTWLDNAGASSILDVNAYCSTTGSPAYSLATVGNYISSSGIPSNVFIEVGTPPTESELCHFRFMIDGQISVSSDVIRDLSQEELAACLKAERDFSEGVLGLTCPSFP